MAAWRKGGEEVALAVLAATLTTAIVFFPVTFLAGVSKFLFTALALSVVLSLFASYFVALSVVPLFCAKMIQSLEVAHGGEDAESAFIRPRSLWGRFNHGFNARYHGFLKRFDRAQAVALARPVGTVVGIAGIFLLSLTLIPAVGLAYFPRTDPGQFVINLKAAPGTRVEVTEQEVAQVEATVRRIVSAHELRLVVANIGSTPDLSSIYTSNSAPNTAYVQVSLADAHRLGSYAYIDRVREALRRETPELAAYFQSGGLVDAVLNQGIPAPIDIQVSSTDLNEANTIAEDLRREAAMLPGVSDAFIPQDIHAPALQLNIDRYHAMEMGLSEHDVVNNVITALTSDGMIAPSYWVDPKSGNLYMLTVQYQDNTVKSMADLRSIPVRSSRQKNTALLDTLAAVQEIQKPTEVDHYQLRRVIDVYVAPHGEELSRVAREVDRMVAQHPKAGQRGDPGSRDRRGHELVLSILWRRHAARGRARLPDPRGPVQILRRPIPDPARGAAGHHRRPDHPHRDRDDPEHHVPDGHRHDGRRGRLEQHSDRRIYPSPGRRGHAPGPGGAVRGPRPAEADFDDFARDRDRADSHGPGPRGRQRILRAARPLHHRRDGGLGCPHRVPGAGGLLPLLSPADALPRGAQAVAPAPIGAGDRTAMIASSPRVWRALAALLAAGLVAPRRARGRLAPVP